MSFGSSFDTKEQVRRAVDIVDLVSQYVPLRREGRGYKGLCPWHDDARPSLQVHPERQIFRCFVCNVGGDIFNFVMKIEGVTFPEALAMLAERAGIALAPSGGRPAGANFDEKRTLYQAMAWAEQQFHDCLLHASIAEPARRYLESRGISSASIQRFHLGFSPESWDWLLGRARDTRFSPEVLEAIGLVARRSGATGYYDRFRGRVLFSIRDTQGRPVGVGGRLLPGAAGVEAPKYINSPETPLFSKSHLLYGLDVAKEPLVKGRTALVMEGYTDCVIAHQCGFDHAVAVLGTALGERHIHLLRRYADRIVLVLDGDEAGRRRADQILELFVAQQVDLRILTLPGELDPCDFLLQEGPEAFAPLLAGAVDALEHKFRSVTGRLSSASGTHEANQALEEILGTLSKAPRLQAGTTSAARLKEDQILHRLARQFGVPEERVRGRLSALRRTSKRPAGDRPAVGPITGEEAPKRDLAERWLVEILVEAPMFLPEVRREMGPGELHGPQFRQIFSKCCELSDAGSEPSFDRLLLEIDDPELKALLVDLDEEHRAKRQADLASDLRRLLDFFRYHRDEDRSRALRAAAGEQVGSEQEELDDLRRIIERERNRQGISVPTEG